jgi:hypothetical protein
MQDKPSLDGSNPEAHMSALGQKQTSARVRVMSALTPKADIRRHDYDVRFVPQADILTTTSIRLMVQARGVLP